MIVRRILTGVTGVAVAGTVGVLAWLLSPVAPLLSGIVFAATALPFGVALSWILIIAPKTVPESPHASDSVETTWLNRALAGTANDLVIVVGLSLAAVSITRVELPTALVLLAILLIAFTSTMARYALARGRAVRS
ncbi:hypothetical protein [Demequina aestuarii]|uniref:hypothetical protein n=1 Tax=Demequina aestuarii TaxID=327095 RepID=UPI000785198F|nr:hypothetical protein [Demequina aestuarii]